jgi:hypothetical protein
MYITTSVQVFLPEYNESLAGQQVSGAQWCWGSSAGLAFRVLVLGFGVEIRKAKRFEFEGFRVWV